MEGIIAAVITGIVAIFVCIINNNAQQKRTRTQLDVQQAETRAQLEAQHDKTAALIDYRLGQLESKVEKHNKLVERMYVLERDMKTAFRRIDENKAGIEKIDDRTHA